MSKSDYYWCQLENGTKQTVGYIPAKGAKVGRMVEMVDLDGEFWRVTSVQEPGVSKDYVRSQEKRFKEFQGSLKGGGIE